MRPAALLIAGICLLVVTLVASAWLMPFSVETADNWRHVQQTVLSHYVWQTAGLLAGVLLVVVPLGVACAWLIERCQFPGRRAAGWMLVLPLAVPAYISAFAYGAIFEYAGPVQAAIRSFTGLGKGEYPFFEIRSVGGASWVIGFSVLPYVYIMARAAFASQSPHLREVAQSLGLSAWQFFKRAALPAARPFIATGAALALMETLSDIGAVHMLGVDSLSTGIYRTWFFLQEPMIAARMAGLLLLFAALLLVGERLSRGKAKFITAQPQSAHTCVPLTGISRWLTVFVCWLPVIAGFLLPVAYVLRASFFGLSDFPGRAILSESGDSIYAASLAGFAVCVLALIMVMAERAYPRLRYTNIVANLGYAVPGAVVAVGVLMLLGQLNSWLGIALTGSMAGLLLAYAVRYIATGYTPLHSGEQRISSELDMVAASLGKSRWQTFRKVHFPLLKLPLAAAFLIVFIDVLKELPATLILRPFDFRTLAIATYEYAGDDRAVEAAPYALAIVALAMIAMAVLGRLQAKAA